MGAAATRQRDRHHAGVLRCVCLASGVLLALLAFLCGCVRPTAPKPLSWTSLPSGLQVAQTTAYTGADHLGVAVHLLRLSPERHRLGVVRALDHGRPLWDAEGFRVATGALAAVNAGYFDPKWQPLGLLVSDGKELSRLRKVDHGVFTVAAHHAELFHAKSYVAPPELEFAIECGPRLVVAGQPLHFKPGTDRRVAIGSTASGAVVLAVSDGVLSLAEWADLLAAPEAKGGAALRDALNLDGGSSAMLSIADGKWVTELRSAVQVPVGIGVYSR